MRELFTKILEYEKTVALFIENYDQDDLKIQSDFIIRLKQDSLKKRNIMTDLDRIIYYDKSIGNMDSLGYVLENLHSHTSYIDEIFELADDLATYMTSDDRIIYLDIFMAIHIMTKLHNYFVHTHDKNNQAKSNYKLAMYYYYVYDYKHASAFISNNEKMLSCIDELNDNAKQFVIRTVGNKIFILPISENKHLLINIKMGQYLIDLFSDLRSRFVFYDDKDPNYNENFWNKIFFNLYHNISDNNLISVRRGLSTKESSEEVLNFVLKAIDIKNDYFKKKLDISLTDIDYLEIQKNLKTISRDDYLSELDDVISRVKSSGQIYHWTKEEVEISVKELQLFENIDRDDLDSSEKVDLIRQDLSDIFKVIYTNKGMYDENIVREYIVHQIRISEDVLSLEKKVIDIVNLFFLSQPHTFVHIFVVAFMTIYITKSMIYRRPEYFYGTKYKCYDIESVIYNEQKILYENFWGALLHDVGKIGISSIVTQNARSLFNDIERIRIKNHCKIGFNILMSSPQLSRFSPMALYHHEHYDGNGYFGKISDKYKEHEADIFSLGLADTYEAMGSLIGRPYGNKDFATSVKEIKKKSGSQFHPDIVNTLFYDDEWVLNFEKESNAFRENIYYQVFKNREKFDYSVYIDYNNFLKK